GELATLTSRGASKSQLYKFQLFEASLICIIAFIFGPLLAYILVWSLAKVGPLSGVNQSDWAANLTTAAWIAAGVSVLACFTALLLPLVPMLRRSIVQHRQELARRSKAPWWQRYYFDVFALVFGLVALWRLSLYGSISGINGDPIDWLLLLAPLALLIGSATVLLRIFPTIFRVLANVAAHGKGLTTALVFWQTSRDPTHVTRLVLLFTLTMALGILSTGLNATLTLSEFERARYSTGGEARISYDSFIPLSSVLSLPQVTSASALWRGIGRANVRSYRNMPSFNILAIEPFSFATVSQYREDFSEDYIGFVLGQLIVDQEQLPVTTIPLEGRPVRFGLWIADPYPQRTEVDLMEYLSIHAKLQSSEGDISTVNLDLQPLDNSLEIDHNQSNSLWPYYIPLISNLMSSDNLPGAQKPTLDPTWRYFEAEIPRLAEEGYPISLHSIWIKMRPIMTESGPFNLSSGPLIIDDLSIQDSNGQIEIIEGFEEISTIWQTDDPQSIASFTKTDITHSGEASMRLYLGVPGSGRWMVVSPAQTTRHEPLPAIASPIFLEMTDLNVGDEFIAQTNGVGLVFEIKNKVIYFPTMYDTSDQGYLIISRDALLAELNRSSRFPVNYNETWIRIDNSQEIPPLNEFYPQLSRVWDVGTESKLFQSDPLTLGLRIVIFLGYSLTLILSLVGFATYFYLNARKRSTIYGIFRSLGLSTRQLYSSLVLEQLFLITSGLGLGILLGSLLNRIILPGLPISFGDIPSIPPFIPQEDWNSVFKLLLIIMVGFFITLALGTFLLWRSKLHQLLRVGEE
ncbi:MAG: FtsX-like permease family protein, partial [Anaerolineales bacterium]